MRMLGKLVVASVIAGGIASVASTANASTATPRNLIGNQLGVIDIASQNSGVDNGNTDGSTSHSTNLQNSAQQIVTDAQSIDVVADIEVLEKPLVLV
ncbi:hypothetical protein AB0M48_35650 [Lentzea sp. NPDC051208]|uniref:hypothetical protein n=1 Tax=Lentzea sp. NPDC051208 TaxID=3154642 RepID=UPI003427D676